MPPVYLHLGEREGSHAVLVHVLYAARPPPPGALEEADLTDEDEESASVLNIKSAREKADRKVIRHALARSEGNISSTAKMLGISRPTLYDLLKQYDLQA